MQNEVTFLRKDGKMIPRFRGGRPSRIIDKTQYNRKQEKRINAEE